MFISVNDPNHFRDSSIRRAVRSHAALISAAPRKGTIAAKAAKKESLSNNHDSVSKGPHRAGAKSVLAKSSKHVRQDDTTSVREDGAWSPLALSPTLGSQGRTDPFRTLPTDGAWHDAIPLLVDTCT